MDSYSPMETIDNMGYGTRLRNSAIRSGAVDPSRNGLAVRRRNRKRAIVVRMAIADTPPIDDPRPNDLKRTTSLVVLFTGPGKGKTSAGMGTVLRAVGQGLSAIVLQFVKSGEWKTGEQLGCERLGVPFEPLGSGFTWDSQNIEHDAESARAAWRRAEEVISSGEYDLVVLDEITYLCTWKWIDTQRVVDVITSRPPHVNVVLTGRDAREELIACADTASHIDSLHHAYDRGIAALKGIDY